MYTRHTSTVTSGQSAILCALRHECWCVTQRDPSAGGFFAVKSTSRLRCPSAKSSLEFEQAVVAESGLVWLWQPGIDPWLSWMSTQHVSLPGSRGGVAYPGEQVT